MAGGHTEGVGRRGRDNGEQASDGGAERGEGEGEEEHGQVASPPLQHPHGHLNLSPSTHSGRFSSDFSFLPSILAYLSLFYLFVLNSKFGL